MEPIRCGVIGVGDIGKSHARAYAEHPVSDLRAVVDVDAERARTVAERHGVRCYTDHREMLAAEDLQAVSIATPEQHRRDLVLACAERGLDILLEKPIARSLEEADEIVGICKDRGVKLMINFMMRFDPRYVAARDAIDRGEVGEILTMYGRRNGTVLGARRLAHWTDLLISTAIHELDCMLWFTGARVRRVYAESVRRLYPQYDVDDAVMAVLRFDSGAIASLETSWLHQGTVPHRLDGRMEIVGTGGGVYIDMSHQGVTIGTKEDYGVPDVSYWPILGDEQRGNLRDAVAYFLRCVLQNDPPKVDGAAGRNALELVLAIRRSLEKEAPVELPLQG